MSGKWHVASSLTQADRHLAAAARLRRVLRHDHRRRQLLRSEHADARQRQHRARGEGRPAFFYTDAISDQAVALHRRARARARRTRRSSRTSPTRRRTGRCTRTTRTSPSTRAASTKGWDALRAERLERAGRIGHPRTALEAHRSRPDASRPGPRPSTRPGCCAAWRSTRRRSTAWTRASAASSTRSRRPASSTNTLVIFLADNGACAEDIPQDVTIDELVDKLMIAQSHTRDAASRCTSATTPVACPGPENTYQSYGTAWANLSQHAVPALQALDPRGRHLDAADRALARRHRRQGRDPPHAGLPARHHGDHPRRRPARPIPTTCDGHAVDAARGQIAGAVVRRRRRSSGRRCSGSTRATPRCASASGSWCASYPGPWELYDMDADRTELHDLAAQHPERVADMAGAVRRLGEALRRDSAREDRRADEEPGRDARVLGEGRGAGRRGCPGAGRQALSRQR